MTESYKLLKEDGRELEFNTGKFSLRSLPSFGNPEITYTTQKGYNQDGETVTNFSLSDRKLAFDFYANGQDLEDPIDAWDLRREILAWFTPLDGPMKFQITLDDHTIYELWQVYPSSGLSLDSSGMSMSQYNADITEPLRLTAFDPVWKRTPIVSSGVATPVAEDFVVFPVPFPIKFGSSGGTTTSSISYEGSWRSYPKITITGPYTSLNATNAATGASFQLIQGISAGETRVIDLTEPSNGFTIVDGNGVNKINELNLDANLAQFYLLPNVTNTITISLGTTDVTSGVTVEYYNQFLGI